MFDEICNIASPPLALNTDEIHIWFIPFSHNKPIISKLAGCLSSDEKNRAERFHFKKDKFNFVARRGMLRNILGSYLDADPKQLVFTYRKNGKPVLSHKCNRQDIRFSLSHSKEVGLYAFSLYREIGIDIESIHHIPNMEQIVNNFFSKKEKRDFQALLEDQKMQAFFNCWTRKEAFIKAIGEGLSVPLDSLDVSLTTDELVKILQADIYPDAARSWTIKGFKPAPGFAAAIAVEGTIRQLQILMWAYVCETNSKFSLLKIRSDSLGLRTADTQQSFAF